MSAKEIIEGREKVEVDFRPQLRAQPYLHDQHEQLFEKDRGSGVYQLCFFFRGAAPVGPLSSTSKVDGLICTLVGGCLGEFERIPWWGSCELRKRLSPRAGRIGVHTGGYLVPSKSLLWLKDAETRSVCRNLFLLFCTVLFRSVTEQAYEVPLCHINSPV